MNDNATDLPNEHQEDLPHPHPDSLGGGGVLAEALGLLILHTLQTQ